MSVCACVLCAFAVEKTGPRAGPTRTSLLPTIECSQLSPAGPARQRLWPNTKLACKGEGRESERERERERQETIVENRDRWSGDVSFGPSSVSALGAATLKLCIASRPSV